MLGCSHILKKAPSATTAYRAPSVTGFHCTSLTLHKAACLKRARAHHTWITGHPRGIAFNNASSTASGNVASVSGSTGHHQACSSSITAGAGAHVSGAGGSFLDFAGNSRFLANNLARFSTFSAVSSSSSSSSLSSPASSPTSIPSSSQQPSTPLPPRGSPTQAPLEADSDSGSGSSSAQAKYGTSASSPTGASSSASSTTSTTQEDDKDDDAWAVNESFSGHGGESKTTQSMTSPADDPRINQLSSEAPSFTSSPSTTENEDDSSTHNHAYDNTIRPSLSSYKDAASLKQSWRRTSDQLPPSSASTVSTPTPASAGTVPRPGGQTQAGNLDLSSSTLVQQMLFGDRTRPSSEENGDSSDTKQPADQATAATTAQERLLTTEPKVDSPSLEQLLDIASNNVASADSATATATTAAATLIQSTPLNKVEGSAATKSTPALKKKGGKGNKSNTSLDEEEEEDHISKLDIRVGIVRSVERHPDAESLYVEQVDVGDANDDTQSTTIAPSQVDPATSATTRTIVSGLVKYIPKDYLDGRAVIVVRNMKPSKLRGIASHGMLLCGMEKDSEGMVTKVELLEPAEGSQPGDKVTFEGFTDENTLPIPVLTPKRKWFEKTQVHFSVQDGIAFYKGSPFKTVRGLVRCRSINKGEIS